MGAPGNTVLYEFVAIPVPHDPPNSVVLGQPTTGIFDCLDVGLHLADHIKTAAGGGKNNRNS